jgi:hypothetical protein
VYRQDYADERPVGNRPHLRLWFVRQPGLIRIIRRRLHRPQPQIHRMQRRVQQPLSQPAPPIPQPCARKARYLKNPAVLQGEKTRIQFPQAPAQPGFVLVDPLQDSGEQVRDRQQFLSGDRFPGAVQALLQLFQLPA